MTLIVLDVDDTLLSTSRVAFQKSTMTAAILGLTAPTWSEFVAGFGRLTFVECLDRWHPGLDPARYSDVYDTLRARVPYQPLGPVAPLLDQLRAGGHEVAVLTNGPGVKTTLKLAACGVAERYLRFVRHTDNARHRKPDPAAFTDLVDDHGVTPADTVYVSDCPDDGAGARAGGWRFAGVTTGVWPRSEFLASGTPAVDVLDDVHRVPAWLARQPSMELPACPP